MGNYFPWFHNEGIASLSGYDIKAKFRVYQAMLALHNHTIHSKESAKVDYN